LEAERGTFSFQKLLKLMQDWVLVTHACNPSYSGDRDQEDCSSKPAQANSSRDAISNKSFTKKGLIPNQ
jgi:hypothetical protein